MLQTDGTMANARPALSVIDRPTLIRLARRTLVLWIMVHVAALLVAAFAGALGTTDPSAGSSGSFNLVAVLAATGLLLFDVRVLNEQRLLANMGIGARTVATVGFLVALLLELALAAALAAT